jgi:plastocyanin
MTPGLARKELIGLLAPVVAVAIATTALASQVVLVVQHDRQFQTRSVDIAVGDTVRFTNEDPFIHQLYTKSPSFSFSSTEQPRGKILSVPFTVAGTFEVRCEIHPKMLLIVNVR